MRSLHAPGLPEPLRYDAGPLARFLFFALPLLLLVLAGTAFAAEALGWAPAAAVSPLTIWREPASGKLVLATWILEAVGLAVLFLLVQSRSEGGWVGDGLATGAIAWLFRGPLLVLTVVAVGRLGRDPWFGLAVERLVAYLAAGLVLALAAQRTGLRRG